MPFRILLRENCHLHHYHRRRPPHHHRRNYHHCRHLHHLDLFLTAVRTFNPREGPDTVVIRPLVVRVAFVAVTPLTMFWANGPQRSIIRNIVVLATYLAETDSLAS